MLMSQTSLREATDFEYLKGMASFGVTSFTQMIMQDLKEGDRNFFSLPRKSLTALLQLPFSLMEQLLLSAVPSESHDLLSYQANLLHELIVFYMDLYELFKKRGLEAGQLVSLNFFIETLILAGGSEAKSTQVVVLNISQDLPHCLQFISELISSVQGRIKGQDSFVQEQFQALASLFSRDIGAFLSDLGLDFLATFGSSSSSGKDNNQALQRDMRRIYAQYKARDSLMLESKKSIVYSLVLKTVMWMFKEMPDQRIMRIADASVGELQKELGAADEGKLK